MATNRPHFSASGPQLQQLVVANKHDMKVLREVLAELKHRSTPTALALRKDVESALGLARGPSTAESSPRTARTAASPPAPPPPAPQPSLPPPPTHQTLSCRGCSSSIRVPIRHGRTAYGCPTCKADFETLFKDGDLQVVWVEVKSSSPGTKDEMNEAVAREILGVPQSADFIAIKAAWRRASQQYHPDKHQGLPERLRRAAELEMKRINVAYRFLEGSTASDF